ncbi:MAG TPA: ABC transporter permease [Actinomycetes bacterium]|jgi:ABC-2 type transport system permease protein|nr:ABC transporter permease [Actinomycetes bacterium]
MVAFRDPGGQVAPRSIRGERGMGARVREIVAHRSVLRLLITRDLKVKYEKSVLGYVWSILEPLLLAIVYYFVFGVIMGVGTEDYLVYLLAGLLPWLWASSTINSSTGALTGQARLIKTTSVPREIWVLRLVGAKWVDYVLSLPVLVLFAILYRRAPHLGHLALLPFVMIVQAILLTGLALLLSSIGVMFRDVKNIVKIVMRLLFYFSPILYGFERIQKLPDLIVQFYTLNPFVGILELNRAVWFPDELHNAGISWISAVLPTIVLSGALFALGWTVFARLERAVLKEL